MAADVAKLDGALVKAVPSQALGFVARRPARCALGSERATLMPSLEDALARYFNDLQPDELPPEEVDQHGDEDRLAA